MGQCLGGIWRVVTMVNGVLLLGKGFLSLTMGIILLNREREDGVYELLLNDGV
jgi:hypothetical protein